MNKRQFEKFVTDELIKWALWEKGWRFEWDRAKTRAGCCMHSKKLITVSGVLYPAFPTIENIDTALHEIAHALAGSGNGHNHIWRNWAVKVGAKPERCYDSGVLDKKKVQYKYTAVCPNGHKRQFNRLGHSWQKGKSCGNCSPRFDKRFLFTIYQNY